MSIPEQFGDSFDFCVLFRVYFTGKGALYFSDRWRDSQLLSGKSLLNYCIAFLLPRQR